MNSKFLLGIAIILGLALAAAFFFKSKNSAPQPNPQQMQPQYPMQPQMPPMQPQSRADLEAEYQRIASDLRNRPITDISLDIRPQGPVPPTIPIR